MQVHYPQQSPLAPFEALAFYSQHLDAFSSPQHSDFGGHACVRVLYRQQTCALSYYTQVGLTLNWSDSQVSRGVDRLDTVPLAARNCIHFLHQMHSKDALSPKNWYGHTDAFIRFDSLSNCFFAFFKPSGERNTHQEALFHRSKMRTIKMLVLSLSAFALAWLPVHLVHCIDFYIYPLMPKQCNSSFTYNFLYWAAISSISFNPFIYCSYDNKFRSTAQRCCCCCFRLRYSEGKWHLPKEPSVRESQRVGCYTSNASASTIN